MPKCPFCGKINKVPLAQPEEVGGRPAMMRICEHFVFRAYSGNPVWEYLPSQLHKNINDLRGVTAYEKDLNAILREHLVIVDDVAFARSQDHREAAKRAVIEFVRAKGYDVE